MTKRQLTYGDLSQRYNYRCNAYTYIIYIHTHIYASTLKFAVKSSKCRKLNSALEGSTVLSRKYAQHIARRHNNSIAFKKDENVCDKKWGKLKNEIESESEANVIRCGTKCWNMANGSTNRTQPKIKKDATVIESILKWQLLDRKRILLFVDLPCIFGPKGGVSRYNTCI